MAMPEDERRTIHQEMHGCWSMINMLPPDYVYRPTTPEEREESRNTKMIGLLPIPDGPEPVPPGTAQLVRERALTDGPATAAMTANAERYTTALEGTWKRDHGLIVCWTCDGKLLLIPRAVRVEAVCLNCCDPFMTEVQIDARLEAVGVRDFRSYNWKRR
jgi:hypothetical protein